MYKIKKLKNKNQINFNLPIRNANSITLIYNDGNEWSTKEFKRTKTKFTCSVNLDKSVTGFEFIYLYNLDGANYYITESDTELIDNPFGTKNNFIRL